MADSSTLAELKKMLSLKKLLTTTERSRTSLKVERKNSDLGTRWAVVVVVVAVVVVVVVF